MLEPLHVLNSVFFNKRIYVWDVNVNSCILFLKMLYQNIEVVGFVTTEEDYINENILGKEIIYYAQIHTEDIVVCSDSAKRYGNIPEELSVYSLEDIITDLNPDIHVGGRNFIYGAGEGAKSLKTEMDRAGMTVDTYLVTSKVGAGDNVIEFEKENIRINDNILISTYNLNFRKEIISNISNTDCHIYVDNVIDEKAYVQAQAILALKLAKDFGRKVLVVGQPRTLRKKTVEILNGCGINVSDIDSNNLEISGVETILVTECNNEESCRIRDYLWKQGYRLDNMKLSGIFDLRMSEDITIGKISEGHDSLVGFSLKFFDQDFNGWKIMGSPYEHKYKIVILGNSTSTEGNIRGVGWCGRLFEMISENYGSDKAVIYNGAMPYANSVYELLKLMRDINEIKPQLVISMSGVCDISERTAVNRFNLPSHFSHNNGIDTCYGLCSQESSYAFWVRIHKMMKMLTDSFGARLLSIMQPINYCMDKHSLTEKMQFCAEEIERGSRIFYEKANEQECYENWYSLFHHKDGMFIDLCHYSDEANGIIAKKVFDLIVDDMGNVM